MNEVYLIIVRVMKTGVQYRLGDVSWGDYSSETERVFSIHQDWVEAMAVFHGFSRKEKRRNECRGISYRVETISKGLILFEESLG